MLDRLLSVLFLCLHFHSFSVFIKIIFDVSLSIEFSIDTLFPFSNSHRRVSSFINERRKRF